MGTTKAFTLPQGRRRKPQLARAAARPRETTAAVRRWGDLARGERPASALWKGRCLQPRSGCWGEPSPPFSSFSVSFSQAAAKAVRVVPHRSRRSLTPVSEIATGARWRGAGGALRCHSWEGGRAPSLPACKPDRRGPQRRPPAPRAVGGLPVGRGWRQRPAPEAETARAWPLPSGHGGRRAAGPGRGGEDICRPRCRHREGNWQRRSHGTNGGNLPRPWKEGAGEGPEGAGVWGGLPAYTHGGYERHEKNHPNPKQTVKWHPWFKKPTSKLTLTSELFPPLRCTYWPGLFAASLCLPTQLAGCSVHQGGNDQLAAKGVHSHPSSRGLAGSCLEINHTLIKIYIISPPYY